MDLGVPGGALLSLEGAFHPIPVASPLSSSLQQGGVGLRKEEKGLLKAYSAHLPVFPHLTP